jgi:hypothetical protein
VAIAACGTAAEAPPGPIVSQDTGASAASSSSSGSDTQSSAAAPRTLQAALEDFGNCMSIDVFMYSQAYKLALETANDGGQNRQCVSCHTHGDYGSFISPDPLDMFEHAQKFPWIMRYVTGTVDSKGAFKDLVPSNRFAQAGQCEEQPCHPTYQLDDAVAAGIDQFVAISLQRWHDKACNQKYVPPQGSGGAGGGG